MSPRHRRLRAYVAALAAVPALGLAAGASGQASAVHRTTLQEQAFPGPVDHTVTVRVVVDPKGEVTPHTHPGVEMGYVLSGQASVSIKGQAPVTLQAGGSFSVPADTVHSVRNTGAGALTLLSTYVVDKTKPIASPAP
jgi:quercetin dioxygenase-like cupin family protein